MPAVIAAAQGSRWEYLNAGFGQRTFKTPDYGISLYGWSFDPTAYRLEVVAQLEETGSSVATFRKEHDAILAINGGYFEIDSKNRLSSSGLLIVDGQQMAPYANSAGSSVFFVKDDKIGIGWSKTNAGASGFSNAVQSGPMVVDPGGKNGIHSNDRIRRNRTAICVSQDRIILVIVKGGISLYEFGEILSLPSEQGGFGCERALNLDGGPSTQASFLLGRRSIEIKGNWNVHNALVLRPKH